MLEQFHDSFEDDPEMGLDLRLRFAVEGYLESKGIKEQNLVAVIQYDSKEIKDRQIRYDDGRVVVTSDGIAWVRVGIDQ